MNKCLNDKFCYCDGKPNRATKKDEISVAPDPSNKGTGIKVRTIDYCKSNLKTCGHYLTSVNMPGQTMALAKLGKKKEKVATN